MAKVPASAKAFAGRWRIVEMNVWDSDFLNEVEEAHITFDGSAGPSARVRHASTRSPERFSIRPWSMKHSFASLPAPLR